MERSEMYKITRSYYDTPGVPETYAKRTDLFKAEEVILSCLSEEIRDKPLLDIGVGAGRTTPHLGSMSKEYVGVDYSANMLAPCKATYKDVDLLLCDARDMAFADESFQSVFFCWNAIDDVDHKDRLAILREIYRVLRRGGVFVFSAHNLDSYIKPAYVFRGFEFSQGPIASLKTNGLRIKRYLFGILNHLKYKKHERREERYSIINDQPYGYRTLTYYITKENQARQLEEIGFHAIKMVDFQGSFLKPGEPCEDGWIYYIARK